MLHFDFDASEMRRIADEFGASEKQIALAYSRALRRTASNMKTQSRKGLCERLGLRSAAELRKRLAGFRFNRGGGRGDLGSVRMWFGLNDLRASAFKGRPQLTADGASMAGRSVSGGFIAKNRKGQRTIMRRVGRKRRTKPRVSSRTRSLMKLTRCSFGISAPKSGRAQSMRWAGER